jgi:hypothetical protein
VPAQAASLFATAIARCASAAGRLKRQMATLSAAIVGAGKDRAARAPF